MSRSRAEIEYPSVRADAQEVAPEMGPTDPVLPRYFLESASISLRPWKRTIAGVIRIRECF